jgi:hypothetical protein
MTGPGSARLTRSGPGAKSKLGQVGAGAKAPAGTGDDQRAHLGSASARSSAAHRSWCIWRLKLLSACGRFSVAMATAPCRCVTAPWFGHGFVSCGGQFTIEPGKGPLMVIPYDSRPLQQTTPGAQPMTYELIEVRTEGGKVGMSR